MTAPVQTDSQKGSASMKRSEHKRQQRRARIIAAVAVSIILALGGTYLLFVFSPVPFFRSMRNIWIETAMTTGEHQWLATAFIPGEIIDDVMNGLINPGTSEIGGGAHLDTHPAETTAPDSEPSAPAETTAPPETTAAPTETTAPPEPIDDPNDILDQANLVIGQPDYAGYTVTVNDIEQGLYITEITGFDTGYYRGYAMLIDDPARVFVGHTTLPNEGLRIPYMLKAHGAIAGINASGFNDLGGQGTGALPMGKSCSNGVLWGEYSDFYSSIVLTETNRLVVGYIPDWSQYNIRDGAQFSPVLVADGQQKVFDSAGWGLQPRTAIGQREDGVIIFLVIDGRDVSHSIGITVGKMAEIMLKYGAVNAACCDGGSSCVLAYNGEVLNKNTSLNPTLGRRLPNAFLVRPKEAQE